jgi:two-component system, cell cycle response regulator DivK
MRIAEDPPSGANDDASVCAWTPQRAGEVTVTVSDEEPQAVAISSAMPTDITPRHFRRADETENGALSIGDTGNAPPSDAVLNRPQTRDGTPGVIRVGIVTQEWVRGSIAGSAISLHGRPYPDAPDTTELRRDDCARTPEQMRTNASKHSSTGAAIVLLRSTCARLSHPIDLFTTEQPDEASSDTVGSTHAFLSSAAPCRGASWAPDMAKILIIEDNPTNMSLTVFLLESAGHSVLTAADAEAGLTLARSELPNLILMDIQLPGMDGLEATALLKKDELTRTIPVIALTALAMKGDEERIRAAGCDGYIAKPMRYQELRATIAAQLDARCCSTCSCQPSAVSTES